MFLSSYPHESVNPPFHKTKMPDNEPVRSEPKALIPVGPSKPNNPGDT